MKKLILFLLIGLIGLSGVYAQIPNRGFEFGFDADVLFANNLMTIGDIFNESGTIVIDLDKINHGFMVNLGVGAGFHLGINGKKGWGFSIDTGLEATGIFNTGGIVSFADLENESFELSGGIFLKADINTYFKVSNFKVTIMPSLFWAAAYVKPDIKYSFNTVDGVNFDLSAQDVRLYTAFPFDAIQGGQFDFSSITGRPGFDLTVGLEFPLAKELGISKVLPFLDFDVGAQLQRIPLFPSVLTNYIGMNDVDFSFNMGNFTEIINGAGSSEDGDGNDGEDGGSGFLSGWESGIGEARFSRPFIFVAYANWRPLWGNRILTITPMIGFAVNQLRNESLAFDCGINATLDLANILVVTAGINRIDSIWINSLDVALNIRLIQINFGVDMRSQEFLSSWNAGGLGVKLGLRLGW